MYNLAAVSTLLSVLFWTPIFAAHVWAGVVTVRRHEEADADVLRRWAVFGLSYLLGPLSIPVQLFLAWTQPVRDRGEVNRTIVISMRVSSTLFGVFGIVTALVWLSFPPW